jgi:hypothetical protein
MKTLKFLTVAFLFTVCLVSYSQTSSTKTDSKTNVYYVQTPHTPDQCLSMLTDMKSKGDEYLKKFEFGCMSGNHTGYAFLTGKSEEDVRQMLPKDVQANAIIKKVDKFTASQIEKLHKDHSGN